MLREPSFRSDVLSCSPLRKMVITSDFYFKTAAELEQTLKEEFRYYPNRIYVTLDEDELNKMLKAKRMMI